MRHRTVVGVAIAFSVVSCDPAVPEPGSPGREPQDLPIVAMPLHRDSLLRNILLSPCDQVPPLPGVPEALTGGPTYENEVHDCQRLVMSGPAFGPLVGVFPLDRAMALDDIAQFTTPRAVATVFNWDASRAQLGMYSPLLIRGHWNCLWLRNSTGRAAAWQAAIVPTDVPCDRPSEAPSSWPFIALYTRPGSIPFPATARWGWDHSSLLHYIGIRCGEGWCAIGRQGLRADRSRLADRIGLRYPMGWYDEEHLAVPGSQGLVPGPWGIIHPTDTLVRNAFEIDDLDMNAAAAAKERYGRLFNHPVRAARIVVEGRIPDDVAPYHSKFNLAFDGRAFVTDVDLLISGSLRAWFDNGTTRVENLNVAYLEQTQHGATGTVRWRWQETDQTAWISCRSGCCDVQEL